MGNSESKSEVESKAIGGAVGGATTAATVSAGVGLMFLGPVGIIAGGVLLGAGISSGVNTVQQVATKGEFKYGQWGTSVGIGALGGAVATPFSAAGGLAATALTSTAAKVGTVVAAEAVGGALSGGVTSTVSKAASGEKVSPKDFVKGAVVGAVSGVIGAGTGQATSGLAKLGTKTVGDVVSTTGRTLRVVTSTVGGAAGGSGGAALAKLVDNAIHKGEMKKCDFINTMKECDIDEKTAEEIWSLLCKNGILVDETVKKRIPDSLVFPEELKFCRELIKAIIDDSLDVSKGVLDAATEGAIIGGVSGAVFAGIQERQQTMKLKELGEKRGHQVKSGAFGGTVEAEAYARQNNKKVVIFHEDGSSTTHGSKSAKESVHLHYSAKDKHYSSADASGKKVSVPSTGKHGNCFFEAIAHQTNDNPATLRQEVGSFVKENPLKLKGTEVNELMCGGYHRGGAGNRRAQRLSKDQHTAAMNAIKKSKLHPDEKQQLISDAAKALKDLGHLSDQDFAKFLSKGEHRGQHHIHALTGDLSGKIAVDIYDQGHNPTTNPSRSIYNRGEYRLIFNVGRKSQLEFHHFMTDHNYNAVP